MSAEGGKVVCPGCQRRYVWKPELAGKRVRCKCGQALLVPEEAPQPEEEGPPDFGSYDVTPPASPSPPAGAAPAARPLASAPAPGTGKPQSSRAPTGAVTAKAKEKITDHWWYSAVIGVGLIPFAFWEYGRLDNLEAHGGSVYLSRYEWLVYQVAGKWGVVSLIALASACALGLAAYKLLKLRRGG